MKHVIFTCPVKINRPQKFQFPNCTTAPIDFIHVVQCEFKGCGFEKKKSNKIQLMPKKLQTRPTSATQENQIVRAAAMGHYGFRNISNQTPIATLELQTV